MMTGSEFVSILSYHSVAPWTRQAQPALAVTPESFLAQMTALREQDVELIRVCDVPGALAEGRSAVAVTIDDGFADAAAYACPVLAGLDIPATLFLPSGYVGGRSRWLLGSDGRRPMLGWSTVRQLADAGFEIGSHGRMHLAADVNAPQVVAHDAMISRHELEQGIGRPVESFAFPYGLHNGPARRAIRQAGYAQACTVDDLPARPGDDRFALPRLQVGAHTTVEDLLALIAWRPGAPQRAWATTKQHVWRLGRRWRSWGPAEAQRLHEVVQ